MYWLLIVLFLPSCRSKLASGIIFLLSEELPLTFLLVHICWWLIPSAFSENIFTFNFEWYFHWIRNSGSAVPASPNLLPLPQSISLVASVSADFYNFWQEFCCHTDLCPLNLICFYFLVKLRLFASSCFQQFDYGMPWYGALYVSPNRLI